MTCIVFDTETTGLVRKHASLNRPCSLAENGDEILQIGGLILDDSMFPVKAFCHYADCLLPESSKAAFETHGISLASIREVIPNVYLEEVIARWLPEFFLPDVVFIGYNTDFDMKMVAQGMRNFCFDFENIDRVMTRLPASGRWVLDTMAYLPKRAKLVSYRTRLSAAREMFYREFQGKLLLETNAAGLLEGTWQQAHNSLFDAIETYLLFMTEVWQRKIFGGGGGSARRGACT